MYNEPNIIISDFDLQRLLPVLDLYDTLASEALETELHRALIVEQHKMPADVVTMNSVVVYEDCETFTRRKVKIVYPNEADAALARISVLAPIGCALLGLRVGQTISWQVANGRKRVRVLEVHYQPEACGDFDL